MSRWIRALTAAFVIVATAASPALLRASDDADGPNDCSRTPVDFGDAPEASLAYPGVPGAFPTCLQPGPVGTQSGSCAPRSTPPGPAGFVRHVTPVGTPPYWLGGCGRPAPEGIDSESNGKTNSTGGPISACGDIAIDCVETAFGMSFGQDECTGGVDAGIAAALTFKPCSMESVAFMASNCGATARQVVLNVLVDMNEDGDWNDNVLCGTQCAYEWAVKNVVIVLPPGCTTLHTPAFLVGPLGTQAHGYSWMRITISDSPVPDDFPWAGSANLAATNQSLVGGETEDYPVTIGNPQDPCGSYDDFGDAPEGIVAYPGGTIGHFPTCTAGGPAGTRDTVCAAISTAPGASAGRVKHVSSPGDAFKAWFGCAVPGPSVDATDGDGKVNTTGVGASACASGVTVDCAQTAFGGALTFGQDECYGDADAGIAAAVSFTTCTSTTLNIQAFNCHTQSDAQGYLNVMVDWNGDGDWNDNFVCNGQCVYEWSVKNQPVILPPGCSTLVPLIPAGPRAGAGWMRITLTASPVPDDFPWAGSDGMAGGIFRGGETEDYPVTIIAQDPCVAGFSDFGDAPEEMPAYSTGLLGRFPTCISSTPPGTQEIDCSTAMSSPPGPTGYVWHVTAATAPNKIWLGCGLPGDPGLGRDSENDGKVNIDPPFGFASHCDPSVIVDSFEPAWFNFGQDESYGTPDAGIASPVSFRACTDTALVLTAWNCGQGEVPAHLNVLVDWNGDGDWNDVTLCSKVGFCRPEWVAKNLPVTLAPGCNTLQVPVKVGERVGEAWMRVTLTPGTVLDDFPWNGSLGEPNHNYPGGETEDYPVRIVPSLVGVIPATPGELEFAPPIPNPAHAGTTLRFALPKEGDVSLRAYDVTGRVVRVIAERRMAAGEQRMTWDFRDDQGHTVPTGLYLVKMRVGGTVITRQVIKIQ
jgi:hypothetical protein